MKKIALVLCFGLSACNPQMVLSTSSALLPVITSSLDAACASSAALASQAKAQPALAGSSTLSKVSSAVGGFCGKVDPTSAAAGQALNTLNTLTAQLLGVAGAAGINLPGLK
jgi:hypothetical protein